MLTPKSDPRAFVFNHNVFQLFHVSVTFERMGTETIMYKITLTFFTTDIALFDKTFAFANFSSPFSLAI